MALAMGALLTAHSSAAQGRSPRITYAVTVKMNVEDVMQQSLSGARGDSTATAALEQMRSLFEQEAQSILLAWREGNEVVTTDQQTGEGKIRKYYHVVSLDYRVIDSFTYRNLGKVDSLRTSLDYRRFRGWKVKYEVKRQKGGKDVLGYACQLYRVVEKKQTASGEPSRKRTFLIWATAALQPPISTHALLGFYQPLLQNLTPLEIREEMDRSKEGVVLHTAVKIEHEW
jgi:hypothetical protein